MNRESVKELTDEELAAEIDELQAILDDWDDDGSYERRWVFLLLSHCLDLRKANMRRRLH